MDALIVQCARCDETLLVLSDSVLDAREDLRDDGWTEEGEWNGESATALVHWHCPAHDDDWEGQMRGGARGGGKTNRLRRQMLAEVGMLQDPRVARHLTKIEKFLLGVATDPAVVAATRAVVLYGMPIGVGLLVIWTESWPPALAGLALPAAMLMRALEGAVDRQLKAHQNDPRPPAGVE